MFSFIITLHEAPRDARLFDPATYLVRREAADVPYLPAEALVRDALVDVGDHHLAVVGNFHFDLVAASAAPATVVALVGYLDGHFC